MNWNAIAAIGQVLASLATFVALGYLAVQVNDAEKEMKRAVAQSRAERNMEGNLALATNERLAAIHVKGNLAIAIGKPYPLSIPPEYAGLDLQEVLKSEPPIVQAAITKLGLTPEEFVMLNAEMSARWNNYSQTILYVDELPPGDRLQFERSLRNGFAERLTTWWWDFSKVSVNPDIVRYVDKLLAQPAEGMR